MGWWHAARPPEPACPHSWRDPGPNRGVLTRASRRDGSPEVTVILTPCNRGPARRGQRASPGPIRSIDRDRQTDRGSSRLVDVSKQAFLGHLAPNHAPGGCDERLLAQGRNAAGCRKAIEEGKEPIIRIPGDGLGRRIPRLLGSG